MKNISKIIIGIVIIAIIIAVVFVVINSNKKEKSKLEPITSSEGLTALIDKLYVGKEETLPQLVTNIVDITNTEMVNSVTGLENGNNLEFLAVSEPLMTSQAYSLVLAKVKEGVNANDIAREMSEKVDPRKWICVTAEKIYATNSGDVVILVMSSEENAKPVYDSFKTIAGVVGQEYEKTQAE